MTKEEFIGILDSYDYEPGTYPEEALIEIGIAHQQLTRAEKNWIWLAERLGLNVTGEQFRKWILAKRYQKGLVPKNPKVLDDKTVDEITLEDTSNSLERQRQALEIVKTQNRDTLNSYRRGLRDEARIKSFNASLVDAIKEMGPINFKGKVEVDTSRPETEMVLGFSDLHIGPDFANYCNTFNTEVAEERVDKLVEQVLKYCELYNVTTLHFLNMGDLISGLIHDTLRYEQEKVVTQQIVTAARIVAKTLATLSASIPVVTYRSCTDNHSRAVADKTQHIERENFNLIIDELVKAYLGKTSVKFPNDNLDIGIGRFKLKNGKKLIFMHGHEDRKKSVVQDMAGLTKEWTDYLFMAHYHNSAEHTFQGAKLFINGSIIGTDSYAFANRLFGEPEQKALIFYKDRDDVVDININLK